MTLTRPALLLLAALSPAGAARISKHDLSVHTHASKAKDSDSWLDMRACVSEEAELACDDSSVIGIYSAFYARASMRGKCVPATTDGRPESCAKNATDAIREQCQGQHRCLVKPSSHPSCAASPHYSMRYVWACIPGQPEAALKEVVEHPVKEVAAEVDNDKDDDVDEPIHTGGNCKPFMARYVCHRREMVPENARCISRLCNEFEHDMKQQCCDLLKPEEKPKPARTGGVCTPLTAGYVCNTDMWKDEAECITKLCKAEHGKQKQCCDVVEEMLLR